MKRFFALFCALATMQWSTLVIAKENPISVDKDGVAMRGYDPIGYFVEKQAMKGKVTFAVKLDDETIYFLASAENRAIFIAEPKRYAPQYGGYCAYGAASGATVRVDPKVFRMIDGKLYLFSSQGIAAKWSKDSAEYIKKADANWSSVPPK
jgi:YHS domain-containing protein